MQALLSLNWEDILGALGSGPDEHLEAFDQPMYTQTVYDKQSIKILLIFFGQEIETPIHDHEGMVVFSKCIKGSVNVDYYDLKEHEKFNEEVRNNDLNRIKEK
jgi:hypothetical protein